MIKTRLDDARAHATLARASSPEAMSRLDDITRGLQPSYFAADGLIPRAKADFYRRAFDHLAPFHDPESHVEDAGPTVEGERAIQAAAIHGRYTYGEVEAAVATAKKHLGLAIRQGTPEALDLWHAKALSRLTAMAWRQLSDGEAAIFNAISYLMIRPELRPDLEDSP